MKDDLSFDKNPVLEIPYDAGKLSNITQQSALNMLKQIRYIAGISDQIQLSDVYGQYAQAASIVNYLNGNLSHRPQQPSGMDAGLFQAGFEGASKSNLSMYSRSGRSINETMVMSLMKDSDAFNISSVGHRRWLLNPKMGNVGFGAVSGPKGTYSSIYVLDAGNFEASETGVAWPAQNMPVEYFAADFAWSISLGYMVNEDNIHVTLTRKSDNKSWNFSKSSSDGDFFIDNSDYSYSYEENGCIIFRPPVDEIGSYRAGDVYEVNITGAASPVFYTVNFFNLEESQKDSGNHSGVENVQNEYTITFSANGGILLGNSRQQTIMRKLVSFPSAYREGYIFKGWFTSATGGKQVVGTQIFDSDMTLYAQWTENTSVARFLDVTISSVTSDSAEITARIPKQYVKSWWALCGSSMDHLQSVEVKNPMSECDTFSFRYGSSIVPLIPETIYYVQICFMDSAGNTVKSDVKSFKTLPGVITNKEYTITFNTNGGVCDVSVLQTTGGKLTNMPVPVKNGYIFKGWFTALDGGRQVTAPQTFSTDMTLYAQWTLSSAETAFTDVTISDITSISAEAAARIPKQYVQSWWVLYGSSRNSMASTAIKDIRKECDNFIFRYGSSSMPLASDTVYYVQFCYKNSSGTTLRSDVKSFRTLPAANTATEYTVVFHANGGTCSTTSLRTTGGKLTYLPVPNRSGYTFDGWYISPDAENRITESTIYKKDCILYAHWTYAAPSSAPVDGATGSGADDKKISVIVQKIKGVSVKNSGKGTIAVSWTWYPQGNGYQIACSTSKYFPKAKTKTKSAGEYDEVKTIGGLKKGKTYYVRVRAYKKVGGKKYYGNWSKVKKIKTRK